MPQPASPETGQPLSPDSRLGRKLEKALTPFLDKSRITCVQAHELAARFAVAPLTVGQTLDRLGIKIRQCQLGLFGHDPKSRIVPEGIHVPPRLEEAIRSRQRNDRLSCLEAWHLADEFGLSRLEICGACEKLSIRISQCQLGAF